MIKLYDVDFIRYNLPFLTIVPAGIPEINYDISNLPCAILIF